VAPTDGTAVADERDAVADANAAGALDDALFARLSDEFGLGWLE
jgi:hypothetical protein